MRQLHQLLLILFTLGLLASPLASKATSPLIDSLEQLVGTLSNQDKINALNELSALYGKAGNFDQSRGQAIEAQRLSSKLKYPKGIADAIDNLGNIYQLKKDYKNALDSYFKAFELRQDAKDALGIAQSKSNIGDVFLRQGELDKAIEQLEASLSVSGNSSDVVLQAKTNKLLGEAYFKKKIYGTSERYLSEAERLNIELQDYQGAATVARMIGNHKFDLMDYEGALVKYRHSLELNQESGRMDEVGKDLNRIGEAYQADRFHEDALDVYQQAIQVRESVQDTVGLAQTYNNIGLSLMSLGKRKEAIGYFEKSGQLLKGFPAQKESPLILKSISESYQKIGNSGKALEYQIAFSNAREAVFDKEKIKASIDLQTKYESQFQAKELRLENESLQKEQRTNAIITASLLGLVGLALSLFFVALTGYRRKKKHNGLLVNKNTEIENQKQEIVAKNGQLDSINHRLVSEMAERESIEQSSFARDKFLATMSHEMRTPINIINGLTHLLLNDEPRPDQAEHLRTVQFSTNNLIVFINDILDFSKIEAGKLSFDKVAFEPKQVFEDAKQRFSLPAKEKGIELVFGYDEKLPSKLMGDPTRLNQVITNLVGNAVNSTDKGKVSIGVKVNELVKDGITLLVSVKDTGKGMPQDKLNEMFQKVGENVKDIFEGYQGADLSLAITKRLVELQNGKIEATSFVGEGTNFFIYLPYELVDLNKEEVVKETKANTFEHLAGNKILLVEDNKINQLVVNKLLTKLGVEVVTADNGKEALKAFEASYYDLVLMDIQMPIMDGYRATAEIRKSEDLRKRDVPIIALTASAFLTEKEKALLFGMNDHVGKPFGPEDLLEKITKALESAKELA